MADPLTVMGIGALIGGVTSKVRGQPFMKGALFGGATSGIGYGVSSGVSSLVDKVSGVAGATAVADPAKVLPPFGGVASTPAPYMGTPVINYGKSFIDSGGELMMAKTASTGSMAGPKTTWAKSGYDALGKLIKKPVVQKAVGSIGGALISRSLTSVPPKIPSVISPAPPPEPSLESKTEVEKIIDLSAKKAAMAEAKKTKKKRGYAETILTSGLGIEEEAPVIKKKLGG